MKRRRIQHFRGFAVTIPGVVGESQWAAPEYTESAIRRFAQSNLKRPTLAERHLCRVLNELNGGVLRGKFVCQHAISGKWIADFYFPEMRLAIEVDGSVHGTPEQKRRDAEKDHDCERLDITMCRLRNSDVFGNRRVLVEKLRRAWRAAKRRENKIIGKPYTPGSLDEV